MSVREYKSWELERVLELSLHSARSRKRLSKSHPKQSSLHSPRIHHRRFPLHVIFRKRNFHGMIQHMTNLQDTLTTGA